MTTNDELIPDAPTEDLFEARLKEYELEKRHGFFRVLVNVLGSALLIFVLMVLLAFWLNSEFDNWRNKQDEWQEAYDRRQENIDSVVGISDAAQPEQAQLEQQRELLELKQLQVEEQLEQLIAQNKKLEQQDQLKVEARLLRLQQMQLMAMRGAQQQQQQQQQQHQSQPGRSYADDVLFSIVKQIAEVERFFCRERQDVCENEGLNPEQLGNVSISVLFGMAGSPGGPGVTNCDDCQARILELEHELDEARLQLQEMFFGGECSELGKIVYFAPNSHDLNPVSRRTIECFRQRLERDPSKRAELYAFTDRKGDDGKNDALALRRWSAVAGVLEARGQAPVSRWIAASEDGFLYKPRMECRRSEIGRLSWNWGQGTEKDRFANEPPVAPGILFGSVSVVLPESNIYLAGYKCTSIMEVSSLFNSYRVEPPVTAPFQVRGI